MFHVKHCDLLASHGGQLRRWFPRSRSPPLARHPPDEVASRSTVVVQAVVSNALGEGAPVSRAYDSDDHAASGRAVAVFHVKHGLGSPVPSRWLPERRHMRDRAIDARSCRSRRRPHGQPPVGGPSRESTSIGQHSSASRAAHYCRCHRPESMHCRAHRHSRYRSPSPSRFHVKHRNAEPPLHEVPMALGGGWNPSSCRPGPGIRVSRETTAGPPHGGPAVSTGASAGRGALVLVE